jgi:hypothetical protein
LIMRKPRFTERADPHQGTVAAPFDAFVFRWKAGVVPDTGGALFEASVSLAAGTHAAEPWWFPDGSWIALSLQNCGNADIHIVRPDGTGLPLVAGGPGRQVNPRCG